MMIAFGLAGIRAAGAEDFHPDSPMYAAPPLASPGTVNTFVPQLKSLWIEALHRPETDLRRQAADAIVEAHRLGMQGLEETAPELMKLLEVPGQHPLVVLTAARALVALDARQATSLLEKRLADGDLELATILEPALEKWQSKGLRELWLRRLSDSETTRGLLILAMRGLARSQEQQSATRLNQIVGNASDPGIRLEAARALGAIQNSGLEETARRLAADKSRRALTERLVSASLLARHQSDAALAILVELAGDSEPAVIAAALRPLIYLKSTQALAIAEKSVVHADSRVRGLCIEMLAAVPTPDRITLIAGRLDDLHPANRAAAREALLTQAKNTVFIEQVRGLVTKALATDSWRAQEQAALLAGSLDFKPTADRLIELLDSPRPEAFIAAAWALRKLSVPTTAPKIHAKLEREGAKLVAMVSGKDAPDPSIDAMAVRRAQDLQFSQLFQALGDFRYAPADSLCRLCINRTPVLGSETRAAAIWTLGHLHAGKPDAELTKKLMGRLSDVDANVPEDSRVRRMAAVSLGRMKAENGLKDLNRFRVEPSLTGAACRWAIHEITGESPPVPAPVPQPRKGWFLEPLEAASIDAQRSNPVPAADESEKK